MFGIDYIDFPKIYYERIEHQLFSHYDIWVETKIGHKSQKYKIGGCLFSPFGIVKILDIDKNISNRFIKLKIKLK